MIKTIAIGCDHAGFPYKDSIARLLSERGINVLDFGTSSLESVDYPDFVHPVANEVEAGRVDFGIVLCGSGNGASMTANKHQGIRCALCWQVELAQLARQHNNANILSIPVRFVSEELALQMVDAFLDAEFEGGRHERRIQKIACS
ncbi:MAG TPA: ribose 5-phosphate isomerase B [Saprospiraceae bacterium]|nr:ribose 5-phosphate isomerase B [Saprospiraceae bacterium]HMQ83794.1 ribose 5-phosphate isomerase B [Saprospiraceae bacterium]